MCKTVEALAEKWAEESRLDTIVNNIRNLMDAMKLSVEQAMDALRVTDEDRAIVLKRF